LIAGALLNMEYNLQYKRNLEVLANEADVYGLALYADGATIAKTPFINILASGALKTNACLDIHDCTGHMEEGGKKDAQYIYELMMKHIGNIDPKKNLVDMVIFDGASNMQKAGQMLEKACPKITCVHGGEHVVSLFFSDVAKTSIGKMLIRLCRKFYKWFGGRHHSAYALFMQFSYEFNDGKAIGLIRPADTRMGGYWIAWTRIYRLKPAFEAMVASKKFQELKKDQRPPLEVIQLLKNDEFWRHLNWFLSAMHGPLRILRYCDMKSPIMDKLYYLGCQATKDLQSKVKAFNDWELRATEKHGFMSLITAILKVQDDSVTTEEKIRESETFGIGKHHAGIEELDSSDELYFNVPVGDFGASVVYAWKARFDQMKNPYVMAGWTLSPHSVIQKHVKDNLNGDIKDTISALVVKLLVPEDDDRARYERSCGGVLNQYWVEWNEFNTRTGKLAASKFFWTSSDIDTNKTWQWHKTNTYFETCFLGKFACRVTSKIAGIGNAERCWGDVKTLKDGKRAHLSSEATSKQATIYGTACAERAEREMQRKRGDQEFIMWDDVDMDGLGVDKYGISPMEKMDDYIPPKKFNCFIEDWEAAAMKDKDPMNCVKLTSKYGGLRYKEGRTRYTIHPIKMNLMKGETGKGKTWHALGCTDDYNEDVCEEDSFDNMEINEDLCGLIFTYYKESGDRGFEIVTKTGTVDEKGKWIWKDDSGPANKKQKAKKKPAPVAPIRASASSSRTAASSSRGPPVYTTAKAMLHPRGPSTRSSPRGKRGGDQSGTSKPSDKKARRER
jgi:hypothetical protein